MADTRADNDMTARPEEKLVYFPCGTQSLAGVLTIPSRPNGMAVLVPWGGGPYPSSGRNRIRIRFAQALAEEGFHAFRFDYLGVGESDGEYRRPDVSKPNSDEIVAAASWLTSNHVPRFCLVANCFGGLSSLHAVPRLPGVEGVALLNSPVRRDHGQVAFGEGSWRWWTSQLKKVRLSRLKSARHRARYRKAVNAKLTSLAGRDRNDTRYSGAVRYLFERNIPVLFLYGTDDFRIDFDRELDRGLRQAIEQAGPPTRVITVNERLQGCASLAAQQILIDEVVPWLKEVNGVALRR